MTEGVFAEVVSACAGGAVLTGWALLLGAGPLVIGLLAALPFLSHIVQLPAAWLTATFGARRTALTAVAVSRQAYLALVPLPFVPMPTEAKLVVLLVVSAFAGVGGVIANNAWVAWMGDLVPPSLRGRYFGRRTAVCSFGGAAASLAAGLLLDHGAGSTGPTLAFLAAAACISGAVTTCLMARMHEPNPGPRGNVALAAALAPLSNACGRSILTFTAAWNAAVGLSSAFYAVHMLTNLGMGFTWIAAHATAIAGMRMLTAPFWGRALDRLGSRPILIACSFGISGLPLLWLSMTPDRWWPIALEAVLSGTLWSGHSLATFTLPLKVAPRESRAFWLAAFATASGVSFALASALAGGIAEGLPPTFAVAGLTGYGLQVLFVSSSTARFAAAWLAVRIPQPEARPVEELLRFAREGVAARVSAMVRVR